MDISRRAYSTPCQFNRNSDVASVVRWEEARPEAEVLPYTSVILSKQQEPDDWFEGGVGEVAGAPRTTTLARAPVGLIGDHICGTETDFNLGGLRDGSVPSVVYGALGWPTCCHPPRRARGGAGGSGRSVLTLRPRVRFRGGAAGSGRSAYTVLSGSGPGFICDDATEIVFGVTYGSHHDGTAGLAHWWFIPGLLPIGAYRITGTAHATLVQFRLLQGSCSGSGVVAQVPDAGGCDSSFIGFNTNNLFVLIQATGTTPAFDYTFTVEEGACPP